MVNKTSSITHKPITLLSSKPVQGNWCHRLVTIIKKGFTSLVETVYWLFSCCFQNPQNRSTPSKITKPVTTIKSIECPFKQMPDVIQGIVVKHLNGTDLLSLYRSSKSEKTFFEKKQYQKNLHKAQLEEAALLLIKRSLAQFVKEDFEFHPTHAKIVDLVETVLPNYAEEIGKYCIEIILSSTIPKDIKDLYQMMARLSCALGLLNRCSNDKSLKADAHKHVNGLMNAILPRIENEKPYFKRQHVQILTHFDLRKAIELMNKEWIPEIRHEIFNFSEENLKEVIEAIHQFGDLFRRNGWFDNLIEQFLKSNNITVSSLEKLLKVPCSDEGKKNIIICLARIGNFDECLRLVREWPQFYYRKTFRSILTSASTKNPQKLEEFLDQAHEAWKEISIRRPIDYYGYFAKAYLSCNPKRAQEYLTKCKQCFGGRTLYNNYAVASEFISYDTHIAEEILNQSRIYIDHRIQFYFSVNDRLDSLSEKNSNWQKLLDLCKECKSDQIDWIKSGIILQMLKTDRQLGEQRLKEYLGSKKLEDVICKDLKYSFTLSNFIRIYAWMNFKDAERFVKGLKISDLVKAKLLLEIANDLTLSSLSKVTV